MNLIFRIIKMIIFWSAVIGLAIGLAIGSYIESLTIRIEIPKIPIMEVD